MGDVLNKAGMRNAHALVDGDKYDDETAWSFSAEDGDKLLGKDGKDWTEYARWFLGENTDATADTKERFKYPFGKDGKVYRSALIAIRQRASQQDDTGIYDAAGTLIKLVDAKDGNDAEDAGDKSNEGGGRKTEMEIMHRAAVSDAPAIVPDSVDLADRSIEMVLSTGAAVRRSDWQNGEYDEVLDMAPSSIRMDRLNAGAPFLDSHDYWSGIQAMLGAVKPGTARLENKKLIARIKFSDSQRGEQAWKDAQAGILRFGSLGYLTHKFSVDDTKTPAIRTATDWEPYECSAVTMPADLGAGFRANETERLANRAQPANHGDRSMTTQPKDAPAAEKPAELDANTRTLINNAVAEGVKTEQNRRDGIAEIGRKLGLGDDFVQDHVRKETTLDGFRGLAIDEAAKRANEAPTTSFNPFPGAPALRLNPKRDPEKGEMAARMIRAFAGAKRSGMSPVEYARTVFKDDLVARAMAAGLEASGGAWVPEEWASELIELLRPVSVIRAAGPVLMPIPNGNMTVPRISSGSNAHYVGENTDITSGDLGTNEVKLSAKKLAAIVPISNDLIRFSSYAADQVVRDDIVRAMAVAEDSAFIRGAGTAFTPKGLRNWALSANIIAANGTVNLANTITDANKAANALEGNNVRMIRPVWIMSPRTKNYLMNVTTTTGAFVWRDEMNGGKWQGYPYKVTNNIPNNLNTGTGSESELYLVDMADVVLGDVPGLMIDVSQEAVYTPDGTNLVSAFSRDQTVIRVIEQHDLAMRHDASVAVLTNILWQ